MVSRMSADLLPQGSGNGRERALAESPGGELESRL